MKHLTATETGNGWHVTIEETLILSSLNDVLDQVRYLNLKDQETTITPLQ